MARLPYVDPQTATPTVRALFERLPQPLNVFKLMAHAETNFRPLLRLGASILAEQALAAPLRELAILETARHTGAEYEWTQHEAIARAVGVTGAQIEAVRANAPGAPCFSDDERLLLAATADILRDGRIPESRFAALRARFSVREIVELVVAVGFYAMIARLMLVADIDPDPPVGDAILRQAR